MSERGGVVNQMTEKEKQIPTLSRNVYVRLKRTRGDDSGDTASVAPPILRVRLDNGDTATAVVMKSLEAARATPLDSVAEGPEGAHTLHFRLLTRAGQPFPPTNMPPHPARSSSSVLSVERAWDLRGCVVMDCVVTEQGRGLSGVSVVSKDGVENTCGGEEKKTGKEGWGCAGEGDGMWSLYVLEKGHAAGDNGMLEEEEEEEVEIKEDLEDEFGFDDFFITQPEKEELKDEKEKRSFVGGGECCRNDLGRGIFRKLSHLRRKRLRDDALPEYTLSFGPRVAEEGIKMCAVEEAAFLCDMLQDYSHECFLLEEDTCCEPELYIYPDHRKDDEYDSNAADFSGNEYPEEPSTSSGASMQSWFLEEETNVRRRRSGRHAEFLNLHDAYFDSGWSSFED